MTANGKVAVCIVYSTDSPTRLGAVIRISSLVPVCSWLCLKIPVRAMRRWRGVRAR